MQKCKVFSDLMVVKSKSAKCFRTCWELKCLRDSSTRNLWVSSYHELYYVTSLRNKIIYIFYIMSENFIYLYCHGRLCLDNLEDRQSSKRTISSSRFTRHDIATLSPWWCARLQTVGRWVRIQLVTYFFTPYYLILWLIENFNVK